MVHNSEAGKLAEVFDSNGIDVNTLLSLKITGEMDARDFRTLWGGQYGVNGGMKSIKFLDLGELTAIRAYEGIGGTNRLASLSGYGNETSEIYRDNEIPVMALCLNDCLEQIVLPPFITSIDGYAFWGAHALKRVSIPGSVTKIHAMAFSGCIGLETIELPPYLEYLYGTAFENCEKLTSEITLPKTLRHIGGGVFTGTRVSKITLSEENSYLFMDGQDVIYKASMDTLLTFPPYFKGRYAIYPQTRHIQHIAARNLIGITAVTFPDIIDTLSVKTFDGCSNLRYINIKTIKHLQPPYSAFRGCPFDTICISSRLMPERWASASFNTGAANSVDVNTCKLLVPEDSVEIFKNAYFWKDFKYLIGVKGTSTSVSDVNNEDNDLLIYPNPFWNILKIKGGKDTYEMSLFNAQGMELIRKNISANDIIETSNYPSGVYLITLKDKNTLVKSQKLIK
ncbi:MAG: leucine-rich repeat protein [Paludibacteraceae bacterium]